MDHFELIDGVLHAEDVPLPVIAAEVGTPVYVYSRATLTRHARVFRDALGVLRNVGRVATRRDGKRIFYSLADANAMQVLSLLYQLFCPKE